MHFLTRGKSGRRGIGEGRRKMGKGGGGKLGKGEHGKREERRKMGKGRG